MATLEETLQHAKQVKDLKEEFILDTVEAFVKANIPIEKLDQPAIRDWMKKYVRNSGELPSANRVRQHYIPLLGDKKKEEIKHELKNNDIFVFCDETTDKNGNCIFNILLRPSVPNAETRTHLAASVVLDAANGANCANAILDTLQNYNIERDHVVAVVTDSARYMTKCVQTLQGLAESINRVQCWAHKINNIGSVFEEEMEELNTAIVKVKNAFLNTRKRKSKYLEFLKHKYESADQEVKIKLFPIPVSTRWNSWFKSVCYLSNHVDDIVEFFRLLDDGNSGVKFFKEASTSTIQAIKLQAIFVAEICRPLMDLITFLEGSSYPTMNVLAGKLNDIEVKLKLLSDGVFSANILEELQQLPSKSNMPLQLKLTNAAQSVLVKLQKLKVLDPAKKIVESVGALFDPRNAVKNRSAVELVAMQKNVPILERVHSQQFLEGHTIFLDAVKEQLRKEDCVSLDVTEILNGLKLSHKEYAAAAVRSIWFPCSNADSERSFSKYSLVVSDRRRRLSAANAETLTMIAFE